jgi:hypothetical protein
MIKFVAAGLWLCAVTIGAVFFSFQMSTASSNPEPPPPLLGGLDYVGIPVISVPVLTNEGIVGYLLTRLVFTAEREDVLKLSVPAQTLFTDQLYSYLFANPDLDFTKVKTLDLDAMRNGIRDSINKRIGQDVVKEVLVDKIDFLSKDEIRDNAINRRVVPTKVPSLGKESAAKPAH